MQLGTIVLKPNENWSEPVRCFALRPEHEENDLRKIIEDARREFVEEQERVNSRIYQIQAAHGGNLPSQFHVDPPKLTDELLRRAESFFSGRRVVIGAYRMVIAATDRDARPVPLKAFTFTIYESDLEKINGLIDTFKRGSPYAMPVLEGPSVFQATLRLNPVQEDQALQLYRQLRGDA